MIDPDTEDQFMRANPDQLWGLDQLADELGLHDKVVRGAVCSGALAAEEGLLVRVGDAQDWYLRQRGDGSGFQAWLLAKIKEARFH